MAGTPEPTEERVKLCTSPSELLSICRLRYMVYVTELKRLNYSYVDSIREILEDPLDHAEGCVNLFIPHPEQDRSAWKEFLTRHAKDANADDAAKTAVEDDFVPSVGCVRVHVPSPAKYASLFSTNDATVWGPFSAKTASFAFFSRFMVHSRYRGKALGHTDGLYAAAALAARRAGARFLLLNCTPALAPLYEAKGWVRYKPAAWDDSMGLQVPMALCLDDLAFLAATDPKGSILRALRAAAMTVGGLPADFPDAAACDWLATLLETRPRPLVSSRTHTFDELQEYMRRVSPFAVADFDVFKGVEDDELTRLFRTTPTTVSVLDVPADTLISRAGDVRDESFIILHGRLEVDAIETLGAGAAVGETAFLSGDARACDVRTCRGRSVVLLLVMSRLGFLKAMAAEPAIAVKLLWNLATGLSRKFTLRNSRLKATAGALEEAQRRAARKEEIADLKETAAKLRTLVIGGPAFKQVVSPNSGGGPSVTQPAGAPSSGSMRLRIAPSPSWEQAFHVGLESVRRLEMTAGVLAPTSRSCGDDDRWRRGDPFVQPSGGRPGGGLYARPATRGVHREELSFCGAVQPSEADWALEVGGELVRIRLNRRSCPKAAAWIDSLLAAGTCANRTRCQPYCCNFYRGEAAVGVHALPDALLRAHMLDVRQPPAWGQRFYWGPPYAFIQGRLWHGGPGPWKSADTSLPSEGALPVLHRGTVELVGGGPDFLIALADHPMMPPHNAFGHVVEEDMRVLDRLIERGPLKVQNWGSINATVFEKPLPFFLRRMRRGA